MGGFVIGILKALLLEAGAILALAGPALRRGGASRALSASCVALAALSFLAFLNFGDLHGHGEIVHWAEQYHFDLGDKYLRELRYDGLYLATDAAFAENGSGMQRAVRDTLTFEPIRGAELRARMDEVRSRFSDKKWKDFAADLAAFLAEEPNAPNLMDHGNTASPSGALLPWLFLRVVPLRGLGFRVLACLDIAMLVGLFFACWRWGSAPIACLTLMPALLAPRVTDYLVGSLFRMDWLVAAAAGALALHRRRFAVAGGFLAYAALSRPFSAAFALGAALGLVGDALRRRASVNELGRFATGGVATALGLGLAAAALFGWRIWPEYGVRVLATVREGYYGINHGFRDLYAQAAVDGPLALLHPVPHAVAAANPGVLDGVRGLVIARALIAMIIAAMCFYDGAVFGAGLGVFLVFVLLVTNTYYQGMWAVFALACAVHAPRSLRARLGLAGIFLVFACRYVFEHFGQLRYAQDYYASWTTFALLVAWCVASLSAYARDRATGS